MFLDGIPNQDFLWFEIFNLFIVFLLLHFNLSEMIYNVIVFFCGHTVHITVCQTPKI